MIDNEGNTRGEKVTLTPKQRKVIETLLTTGDKAKAAKAAGVARKTIYEWLRQPAFVAELRQAEAEALDALGRALVTLGNKATKTLQDAMTGKETAMTVKVRAADITLGRLLQLRELANLESRVAELERRAKAENEQP